MEEKKTRNRVKKKTELKFGYKYTPEEAKEITEALEKIKTHTGKTTSLVLYEILLEKAKEIK